MGRKTADQYSDEGIKRRFEAALRGARAVGHEPMKSLPRKRVKKRPGGKKVKAYDQT